MNREEFTEFMHAVFERDILKLNDVKGSDYAGSADVFRNFSSNGERLGLHPYQVWAVYFSKHIDAIITFTKDGSVKSEPVEGRIDDAIMYLFLLRGMVASENQRLLAGSVSELQEKGDGIALSFDRPKHGADALKAAGEIKVKCTCPPHYTSHAANCPATILHERLARGNPNESKPSPKPRN